MDLQAQVIKTQGQPSKSYNYDSTTNSRRISRSELPSRRLSETFSSSIIILGNTAESAYHRIQEHVQRTVIDLRAITEKMGGVTSNTADTVQDLIYSDEIMGTLDESEQALSRAVFNAKVATERLVEMRTEIEGRLERRGSSVVYRRGGPGVDTLVVRT